MSSRDVTVHDEIVGEPRDGQRDNILIRVGYMKGRGYGLSGRVQRVEDGCATFVMFTGINHNELLEHASRFGKKKLETIADRVRGSEELAAVVSTMKAELERRIAAGEEY